MNYAYDLYFIISKYSIMPHGVHKSKRPKVSEKRKAKEKKT